MSASLDKSVVKVTIKQMPDCAKLTVLGKKDGAKEPTVFYRARCANMDDALEQLKNWRTGVIIV